MSYALEDSITVVATPEQVYALVSDVTRTGEWSVQTERAAWDGQERGVGATFTGHNRTAEREWTTVSTVVAADPGREFAWTVGPGRARWGYRMQGTEGGTLLTLFTATTETTEAYFAERFGDAAAEQLAVRQEAARDGIPVTLARIAALLG